MASKITKWAMDWTEGVMTCTIDAINKVSTFDVKTIFPEWADLTEIQKHCIYTGLKPKLEDTTALGKEMKQTPGERYASISNMWDRLTVDEVWSKKGEREDSPQKKLAGMKVISVSMAKAAVLLGMKVGSDTKVLSDVEYDEFILAKDQEENSDD